MKIEQKDFDNLSQLNPVLKQKLVKGRFYNTMRVVVVKGDNGKYTAVAFSRLERFKAALLKIFCINYYKNKLKSKTVKIDNRIKKIVPPNLDTKPSTIPLTLSCCVKNNVSNKAITENFLDKLKSIARLFSVELDIKKYATIDQPTDLFVLVPGTPDRIIGMHTNDYDRSTNTVVLHENYDAGALTAHCNKHPDHLFASSDKQFKAKDLREIMNLVVAILPLEGLKALQRLETGNFPKVKIRCGIVGQKAKSFSRENFVKKLNILGSVFGKGFEVDFDNNPKQLNHKVVEQDKLDLLIMDSQIAKEKQAYWKYSAKHFMIMDEPDVKKLFAVQPKFASGFHADTDWSQVWDNPDTFRSMMKIIINLLPDEVIINQ